MTSGGQIPLSEWIEVSATLACGCYASAHVYSSTEGLTAEDALNRYGATFLLTDHDGAHMALCHAAAPPLLETPFWLDSVSELGHAYPSPTELVT